MMILRRLFIASLICLLAFASSAQVPGMFQPLMTGSSNKAVAFQASTSSTSNLTTYTFSTVAIGPVTSDRYVAVGVLGGSGALRTISSVTLDYGSGPVAMTDLFFGGQASGTNVIGMFVVAAPTGNTTGTFVIVFSAGEARCGIGVWTVTGISSATPISTGASSATNPNTAAISSFDGQSGVAIGVSTVSASSNFTWTNATEDFDIVVESAVTLSGASISSPSIATITATPGTSTNPIGLFARW